MKKAWDKHKLCTRCKKTRTKEGECARCRTLKPLAHLLARIEIDVSAPGNVPKTWCDSYTALWGIIVLSPRDAVHQGYAVCEDCLMARDT